MAFGGGGPVAPKSLNRFPKKLRISYRIDRTTPRVKIWLQSVGKGHGCGCEKFAVRRLFVFFFLFFFHLRTATGQSVRPTDAATGSDKAP